MKANLRLVPSLIVTFSLLVSNLGAENWAQFRGATGSGVSGEKNLPLRWSPGSGIAWSASLAGQGNSCPAVTSQRIHLTTELDNDLWVLTFDRRTGKMTRRTKVGSGKLAAKGSANLYAHRHNAATPTPVADDDHVWAFFGTGLLVCLEAESGRLVWKRDLAKEYGAYDITFGMGSSPRLWGSLIYISCLTKGPSYVVALDKLSGRQVWKSDRRLPAKDDGPDAYSTPSLIQSGTGYQLLVSGSDHINAYDLKTGRQRWFSAGLTVNSKFGRIIASPAADKGIVVATAANPGGGLGRLIGIRGNGQGNVTASNRLWDHTKSCPDSSTPVCFNGSVYMVSDKGVATCLDLESGKVHWVQRLPGGPYHASVVAGDGKVYFLGIDGRCTVMAADKKAKVLSSNRLQGTFYSTPAIAGSTIYLRAYERLYAIKGR